MIGFISIVCLIAGAQGIFLSLHFILKKSGEKIINLLVAILLLIYSVNLINTYCYLSGFGNIHHWLQPVANYLGWWAGPSIWLYITYQHHNMNWKKIFLVHYAPIIVIAFLGQTFPSLLFWLKWAFYIQFSCYVGLSIYYYYKNTVDRKFFDWIALFVYSIALIKIVNIIIGLAESTGIDEPSDVFRISIIVIAAIPIFIMAYREMNMNKTFEPHYEKYGNSRVDNEELESYSSKIKDLIEEDKLYLNPSFKISDLSDLTGLNPRKISQVINETQEKNFSAFINDYRLEEIKRRLINEKYSNLSILGIAQECGFRSSGRFNTLFKEKFGETPSQYRKSGLKFE
ncbi:helix-turn-helix domain-containing protein [Marinigracilibium pacificum]|uniref:AraC family transcriptional regulator n=1 Tax=Marinigracilibium pacificum TaxID=2729599 RepID=A0A848ISZ1_9BACT|nr:helix-turn-helix domain-containing protein [Marinigracilibium pacificum]NMM47447.1 AraC family transcriptional regulator [Marinigracilibium pacificum]